MKKLFIFVIIFCVVLSGTVVPVFATYNSEVEVDANIAYLISLDKENTVIYDKNSEVRFTPAAIVKIVTGILVIENCADLSQMLTADETSIYAVSGTGTTTAGIYVGEQISVEELLYCALVYNAGDAASILATFIGGTQEAFVEMMNDFAARLGCTNTHFTNPVGYDQEGQYTTARELAAIYYYCISNSTFDEIISTDYYEMEPTNMYGYNRYLKTTNGLINFGIPDYYYKYVKSGKSGVTGDDRCNSVSVATKDGYNYLCVVMDAGYEDFDKDEVEENMAFVSAKKLYEWTFDNIRLRVVASPSQYVWEMKVKLSSEYDYVSLVPAEEISALVPSGVNEGSLLIEPIPEETLEYVKAPVKKGQKLGRATIKYAGEPVAEVDLVAAFDVSSNLGKWIGDMLLNILKSTVFRIIFLIALAAGVVFLLLSVRSGRIARQKNTLRLVKKTQEGGHDRPDTRTK